MGIIATKLASKVAISSVASFKKATDNGNNDKFIYGSINSKAVNFSLSIGKLMLSKEYRSYRQTNINWMM